MRVQGGVVTEVLEPDVLGRELVEAHGYRMARRGVHMTVDLDQAPTTIGAPPGIEIRGSPAARSHVVVRTVTGIRSMALLA